MEGRFVVGSTQKHPVALVADLIVVLDRGRLAELIDLNGRYQVAQQRLRMLTERTDVHWG